MTTASGDRSGGSNIRGTWSDPETGGTSSHSSPDTATSPGGSSSDTRQSKRDSNLPDTWKYAAICVATGILGMLLLAVSLVLVELSTTVGIVVAVGGFSVALLSRICFPFFILRDQRHVREHTEYRPFRAGYVFPLIFGPPPIAIATFGVYLFIRHRAVYGSE